MKSTTFEKYVKLREADMDRFSTGHTNTIAGDDGSDWSSEDIKGNATSPRDMHVDRNKSFDPRFDSQTLMQKLLDPKNVEKVKAVLDQHPEMAEKLQSMLASGIEANQGYDYYRPSNQPDNGWYDQMKQRHSSQAQNTVDSIKDGSWNDKVQQYLAKSQSQQNQQPVSQVSQDQDRRSYETPKPDKNWRQMV